ncbi:MAG: CRISPR-associated endonuclease Cas1, partial [Burkholderiaceae bacterium]|nr:CRISPR-associated endonuclease Cas1 [Burkholderiaceae bacterium]
WVQGEWADNADTVEGRAVHRRVDKPAGDLPSPQELTAEDTLHARSITLSSDRLGLIARMDVLEAEEGWVVPIDYKRGKRPHIAGGAYEPERVQLCAQALILEEHGYRVREGVLYFAGSRERVRVQFDEALRAQTHNVIDGLRLLAAGGTIPPPLVDSPKCPRCSLVGICLPDEVNFLLREETPPRPLAVGREEAMPMYVQAHRAKVSKNGETIEVSVDEEKVISARLAEVSQLVVMGNVYVTTPTLQALMEREITVSWHSYGGWFIGHTIGTGHKNVELRTAQYRASFDDSRCLRIARGLVAAKIQNARTLLRRNWKGGQAPEALLDEFRRDIDQARRAGSIAALLGVEGNAAARYFRHFKQMISAEVASDFAFDFERRNRRPPPDPVNALLSFAYALLVRAWTVTLSAVGLDPYRGFYHQPRYGRPALALDLMEPFRPLIADSSVIQAINNGEVKASDFVRAASSVALTAEGRKRFIAAFERRLGHEATHPLFGYKVSYRRLLELQARLFGRYLMGELAEYPNFVTR